MRLPIRTTNDTFMHILGRFFNKKNTIFSFLKLPKDIYCNSMDIFKFCIGIYFVDLYNLSLATMAISCCRSYELW